MTSDASGEEVLGQRRVAAIMAFLGLCVMAIAAYRAATVSFTHDESYSYIYYVGQSYLEIAEHIDAFTNNHLLNSLGMKVSQQLFGGSELALRLPNLLALGLFLFYAARMLVDLPAWLAVGGFVVLGTNSYMLELFTLARGYGLSFGFMMMAMFHLVRAAKRLRLRDVVLFHVASVLATLSNFTLLNVHFAGLMALYMVLLARVYIADVPRRRLLPITIANAVMVAISVAVLWHPLRKTLEENAMDFGGKSGFFSSTVTTWVVSLIPRVHIPDFVMIMLYGFILLLVVAGLVVTVQRFRRGDAAFFTQWTALPVVLLVLVLTSLGGELQHALFGVDRLTARFALFFVPLLVLLIVYLLTLLYERGWRMTTSAGMIIAAIWGIVACTRTFGPSRSVEWQYDLRTKDAVAAIARDMDVRDYHGPPLRVGIDWVFEPAMNFYRMQMGLDRIQHFDRSGFTTDDAYRLVFLDQEDSMVADGYVQMENYAASGTVLFKRGDRTPQIRTAE